MLLWGAHDRHSSLIRMGCIAYPYTDDISAFRCEIGGFDSLQPRIVYEGADFFSDASRMPAHRYQQPYIAIQSMLYYLHVRVVLLGELCTHEIL